MLGLQGLLLISLVFLSGEIVMRRFFFEQVPTQIPALGVYTILLINSFVVVLFVRDWRNQAKNSRTNRNSTIDTDTVEQKSRESL
jgi:hypothetical protein